MPVSINSEQIAALRDFGRTLEGAKMSLSVQMRMAIEFLTLEELKAPLEQLTNALDSFIQTEREEVVLAKNVRASYLNLESIVGQLRKTQDETKFTAINLFIDKFAKVFPLDSIKQDIDSSLGDLQHYFLPSIISSGINASSNAAAVDHENLVINTARLLEVLGDGQQHRSKIDDLLGRIGDRDDLTKLKQFLNLFFEQDIFTDEKPLQYELSDEVQELIKWFEDFGHRDLTKLVCEAFQEVQSDPDQSAEQLLLINVQWLMKRIDQELSQLGSESTMNDVNFQFKLILHANKSTSSVARLKSFIFGFSPRDGSGGGTVRGASLPKT